MATDSTQTVTSTTVGTHSSHLKLILQHLTDYAQVLEKDVTKSAFFLGLKQDITQIIESLSSSLSVVAEEELKTLAGTVVTELAKGALGTK